MSINIGRTLKRWSFRKHSLFSLIFSIIIYTLVYLFNILAVALRFGMNWNQTQAGSIAIIGGADGPTAIYTTSSLSSITTFIWGIVPVAIMFLFLLLLYKPIKKIIERV